MTGQSREDDEKLRWYRRYTNTKIKLEMGPFSTFLSTGLKTNKNYSAASCDKEICYLGEWKKFLKIHQHRFSTVRVSKQTG